MISCALLINGVLDNNLELSVNTIESSLGFVSAVSMALGYLQEVLCELPCPNSIAEVRLQACCHAAKNFMSSKTPENIISEASAAWRPMQLLGI